ncbi:MAG: hypothetical protein M0Z61_10465 [Nitrospiraceae bacterium]|nr:hypothetical protein [Nitrospiraceae bacterium]
MNFIALLKAHETFFGITAPDFSWIASVGLILFPLYYAIKLNIHSKRESLVYSSVINQLGDLQKEYILKPGAGLSEQAYDSIAQIFNKIPSLLPAWSSYKAKIVRHKNNDGDDQFWSSACACTDFNEDSLVDCHLNTNFYTSIPGIVTGTGLFFTFLAILVALLDVKKVGPEIKGIELLIQGLSGKFLSSVAALLAATVFIVYEKRVFHKLNAGTKKLAAAIDNNIPYLSLTQVLLDINNDIAEQTKAFRLFNTDLSLTLKSSFSESLGPTLEHMIETIDSMKKTIDELNVLMRQAEENKQDSIVSQIQSLVSGLKESIESSLQRMGDSFSTSLSGSAMSQFDKVANSLGGTSELLQNMNGQFLATQQALNDLIGLAKNSTTEQIELGRSQVESLTNVLKDLMIKMQETTGSSVSEISSTLTAVTYALSEKVSLLGQEMATIVRTNTDKATGAAEEVIQKAGVWTQKSAEQLDNLVEKYQAQIELTSELKDALRDALGGFKDTLDKYGAVTGDLKQITTDANVSVNLMTQVSKTLKDNQEALKTIAGATREQIQDLKDSGSEQMTVWKEINNSMVQYRKVFTEIKDSCDAILLQIADNMTDYTEQADVTFKKVLSVSNELFGTAYNKLKMSVEDLNELLQDLSETMNTLRQRPRGIAQINERE